MPPAQRTNDVGNQYNLGDRHGVVPGAGGSRSTGGPAYKTAWAPGRGRASHQEQQIIPRDLPFNVPNNKDDDNLAILAAQSGHSLESTRVLQIPDVSSRARLTRMTCWRQEVIISSRPSPATRGCLAPGPPPPTAISAAAGSRMHDGDVIATVPASTRFSGECGRIPALTGCPPFSSPTGASD